jgi:hypothetical protein
MARLGADENIVCRESATADLALDHAYHTVHGAAPTELDRLASRSGNRISVNEPTSAHIPDRPLDRP